MTWTERLKAVAAFSLKQYPQYEGYHDNWVLAMGTRIIRYKGGTVLARGRYVLANPELTEFYDPDTNHHCGISLVDDLVKVRDPG